MLGEITVYHVSMLINEEHSAAVNDCLAWTTFYRQFWFGSRETLCPQPRSKQWHFLYKTKINNQYFSLKTTELYQLHLIPVADMHCRYTLSSAWSCHLSGGRQLGVEGFWALDLEFVVIATNVNLYRHHLKLFMFQHSFPLSGPLWYKQ